MTYKVQGIIIGKDEYRDTDKSFVLYTREQGKIDVLAQGVRKSESKLNGELELLNYGLFTLAKGRSRDRIAIIDDVNHFQKIKSNVYALSAVLYCFEIFDSCVKAGERDEELFVLLTDFLSRTEKCTRPLAFQTLAYFFLLKLASILGVYEAIPKKDDALSDILRQESWLDDERAMRAGDTLKDAVSRFLERNLDRLPRSQSYFDLLTPKEKVA